MVNFTEGYKAGKGDLVTHFSYSATGERSERTCREPVPATAFITAKGHDFEVMIHKAPPGRKDYLIDKNWRTAAKIKIQGVVIDQLFKELDNDNACLWNVTKKFQKDASGADTATVRSIKVTLQVKDVEKVLSVITKVCNFDDAAATRVSAFMGLVHEIRETETLRLKAKTDRDVLLQSIWTTPNISKATMRLVHDLAQKDPTEKRNILIRKAMQGMYSDFSSPLATPQLILAEHLKEVGCPELAQHVYTGRYDD